MWILQTRKGYYSRTSFPDCVVIVIITSQGNLSTNYLPYEDTHALNELFQYLRSFILIYRNFDLTVLYCTGFMFLLLEQEQSMGGTSPRLWRLVAGMWHPWALCQQKQGTPMSTVMWWESDINSFKIPPTNSSPPCHPMALCKAHGPYNTSAALTPESNATDDDGPTFGSKKYQSSPPDKDPKTLEADRPIGYGAFGVVWWVVTISDNIDTLKV